MDERITRLELSPYTQAEPAGYFMIKPVAANFQAASSVSRTGDQEQIYRLLSWTALGDHMWLPGRIAQSRSPQLAGVDRGQAVTGGLFQQSDSSRTTILTYCDATGDGDARELAGAAQVAQMHANLAAAMATRPKPYLQLAGIPARFPKSTGFRK